MGRFERHIPRKPYLRKWIDRYKSWRLYKYYTSDATKAKNDEKMIIYMADGRMKHGGLSDRICGMVSAYNYCKKHGLRFKIYFISPYRLYDFLECAIIDWRIDEDDISYNSDDAVPIYLSLYSGVYEKVDEYFNSKLGHCKKKQIHLYTNSRYFHSDDFPQLFRELFKPSMLLQRKIDDALGKMPIRYVSLTFRFQQLLGDFKEDGFTRLKTPEEKESLINKCIDKIKSLYEKTKSEILVTSDSATFLSRAGHLEHVYVIEGNMRHEDYGKDLKVDYSTDAKSFVDLYLLANAEQRYIYIGYPMYYTGFPITASLINNKSWIELK